MPKGHISQQLKREAGHLIQTIKDWDLNGLATYHLIKLAAPKAKVVIND